MSRKSKHPGLYFDPKTGQGRIDKRVNGIRLSPRFEASSWAEAEQFYLQAIRAEEDRQANAHRPRQRTFGEAAAKFLLDHQHLDSIDRYAKAAELLQPHLAHLPLGQVHQGAVDPYIQARKDAGMKSSTVAREIAFIRTVLTQAARVWREPNGQPWLSTAVPLFKMPNWKDAAEPHLLQIDEERKLLQALPPHLQRMFLFALNTGQRQNVICRLRWEWETRIKELGTSVFVIPGRAVERYGWTGTKTERDCIIPLNATARRVIEGARGAHPEWVFVFRGEPVARINNTAWRNAWRTSGLPTGRDVLSGPHNLRHLFATRLRMAGVPERTISTLLNHADGNVTTHYSRAELRELIAAVEALEEVGEQTILRIAR